MVFGLAARRLKELRTTVDFSNGRCQDNQAAARNNEISRPSVIVQDQDGATASTLLTKWNISIQYVTDPVDVAAALSHLESQSVVFGVDIETYPLSAFVEDKGGGLDPRKSGIRLVQFFDGNQRVFVFDLMKLGGIQALTSAIWQKPMVAHNAMFELKHLLHNGISPMRLGCTLLADRCIHGNRINLRDDLGLSKSATLKDLAKELLKVDVSKELQSSDWAVSDLSPEQIAYAALDAVLVAKIFPMQWEILQKNDLCRAYRILRDAQRPVAEMELVGIGFDVSLHRERIAAWQQESETLRRDILETLGRELNLNSGKQLNEWLNEALKQEDLETWAKTEKGQLSTSTHTFKLQERMHDMFPKLVEYRHLAKRISSFGEGLYKFIDEPANRLYGSFSLGATVTGRMASSKPNMQNMPRAGFRDLFCAKSGHVFVSLDYSQQELRVAALVTQDKELLRIYAEGGDVHVNTAAAILKIEPHAVGKEHRQLAKAVIFGLLYGQGAKGLAIYAKRQYGVDMTLEEAERHRSNLFKTYKGLRRWQQSTGNLVQITHRIRTECGRLRDFGREKLGYSYTAALNLPIQGAAAEITLHALTRIVPLLCDDCRLVNVIHDEILLEVRQEIAEECAQKAKEAMIAAFLDVFPNSEPYLKGLVEAKIGKNWAEAK
jgi:DNA polymerase-1